MKNISLIKLFLIFIKIGAILLGGGYVIFPILTDEFIEKRNLIQQEDLINYFAISQSLPGIIAANISIMIGYKLRGVLGAFLATLGIVLIPFISIVILATFISNIVSNPYIIKAFEYINIAIIALILLTVKEFLQKTKKDKYFFVMFILVLITLLYTNCSPLYIILFFTPLGVLYKFIFNKKVVK